MRKSLLFILPLLALIPLWLVPFYSSHDGFVLVARFAAYWHAFSEGSIIPRWAGDFNFGYGSPVLNFYYPLPGYLASLLHLLGASYELCFKIIISTAFILSFFTFYLWLKQLFKKDVAIIGALLYGFLPYHFLNLYVRGDIGELVALAIVPLVFYFIDKQKKNVAFGNVIGLVVTYGLLILSHNGISLMFTPVIFIYLLLHSVSKKNILSNSIGLVGGLAISSFFWLPALYEQRYVNGAFFIGDMYKNHFLTFRDMILFRWGFGPDVHSDNGLSPHLGILQEVIALCSVVGMFLKKRVTKVFVFWIVVALGTLFITSEYSSAIWKQISVLRMYQFPWRFIALTSFSLCVIATYGISLLNGNYKKVIVVVICILVIPYLQLIPRNSLPDKQYESYTSNTYFHGEASTVWSAGDPGVAPESKVEIISGEGKLSSYRQWNSKKTYSLFAKSDISIKDNTLYYPGWKVYSGNVEIPIEFQDMNHRGFITYDVSKGEHLITVQFEETKIRLLANMISLVSVLVFSVLALVFLYRKKFHER